MVLSAFVSTRNERVPPEWQLQPSTAQAVERGRPRAHAADRTLRASSTESSSSSIEFVHQIVVARPSSQPAPAQRLLRAAQTPSPMRSTSSSSSSSTPARRGLPPANATVAAQQGGRATPHGTGHVPPTTRAALLVHFPSTESPIDPTIDIDPLHSTPRPAQSSTTPRPLPPAHRVLPRSTTPLLPHYALPTAAWKAREEATKREAEEREKRAAADAAWSRPQQQRQPAQPRRLMQAATPTRVRAVAEQQTPRVAGRVRFAEESPALSRARAFFHDSSVEVPALSPVPSPLSFSPPAAAAATPNHLSASARPIPPPRTLFAGPEAASSSERRGRVARHPYRFGRVTTMALPASESARDHEYENVMEELLLHNFQLRPTGLSTNDAAPSQEQYQDHSEEARAAHVEADVSSMPDSLSIAGSPPSTPPPDYRETPRRSERKASAAASARITRMAGGGRGGRVAAPRLEL